MSQIIKCERALAVLRVRHVGDHGGPSGIRKTVKENIEQQEPGNKRGIAEEAAYQKHGTRERLGDEEDYAPPCMVADFPSDERARNIGEGHDEHEHACPSNGKIQLLGQEKCQKGIDENPHAVDHRRKENNVGGPR